MEQQKSSREPIYETTQWLNLVSANSICYGYRPRCSKTVLNRMFVTMACQEDKKHHSCFSYWFLAYHGACLMAFIEHGSFFTQFYSLCVTTNWPSPLYSSHFCFFLTSPVFYLPFSAPCSWMGGESIARALAAAPTGYGKELNWPPLTLPVLLWLMLLPQQEKSTGLEGGAMETAPLSHACKKALASSSW